MLLCCHAPWTACGDRVCCYVVMLHGQLVETEYVVMLSCSMETACGDRVCCYVVMLDSYRQHGQLVETEYVVMLSCSMDS